MNNITARGKWTVFLLIGGTLLLGQGRDIKLNATRSEEHVLRKMVVVNTSGEKMSTFDKIVSFDPASNVFVMEDVRGGTMSIPSSEIREINFEQTVEVTNSPVQRSFPKVTATPGSKLKYRVPKGAIRVDSGDLVLPASSPSTKVDGDGGNPPSSPSGNGVNFSRINVVEPRRLTVDAHGFFIVEVQNVIYTTETPTGGSKASGAAK